VRRGERQGMSIDDLSINPAAATTNSRSEVATSQADLLRDVFTGEMLTCK